MSSAASGISGSLSPQRDRVLRPADADGLLEPKNPCSTPKKLPISQPTCVAAFAIGDAIRSPDFSNPLGKLVIGDPGGYASPADRKVAFDAYGDAARTAAAPSPTTHREPLGGHRAYLAS